MRPRRREAGIIVRELSDETIVYDLERHRAHCLNASAARVWRLCDGARRVEEITTQLSGELKCDAKGIVKLALDQLGQARLLGHRSTRSASGPRLSRRAVVRTLSLTTALLPAVVSILVPTAAMAASPCPDTTCEGAGATPANNCNGCEGNGCANGGTCQVNAVMACECI